MQSLLECKDPLKPDQVPEQKELDALGRHAERLLRGVGMQLRIVDFGSNESLIPAYPEVDKPDRRVVASMNLILPSIRKPHSEIRN
jgi:hypothetical protein